MADFVTNMVGEHFGLNEEQVAQILAQVPNAKKVVAIGKQIEGLVKQAEPLLKQLEPAIDLVLAAAGNAQA